MFVGQDEPAPGWLKKVEETLGIVLLMVRSYTRGVGFDESGDPNDALGAVIITCTARLSANPELQRQSTQGPFSVTHGLFNGWTLPELAVLNAYRKRAA